MREEGRGGSARGAHRYTLPIHNQVKTPSTLLLPYYHTVCKLCKGKVAPHEGKNKKKGQFHSPSLPLSVPIPSYHKHKGQ